MPSFPRMGRSRSSSKSSDSSKSSKSSSSSSDSDRKHASGSTRPHWFNLGRTSSNHNDNRASGSNEAARNVGTAVILALAQTFLSSSNMPASTTTSTSEASTETSPLLPGNHANGAHARDEVSSNWERSGFAPTKVENMKTRGVIWGTLTAVFLAGLVVVMLFQHLLVDSFYPWLGLLPRDPMLAALAILDNAPVIVRLLVLNMMCWAYVVVHRMDILVRNYCTSCSSCCRSNTCSMYRSPDSHPPLVCQQCVRCRSGIPDASTCRHPSPEKREGRWVLLVST
jgi:hypothetical protein